MRLLTTVWILIAVAVAAPAEEQKLTDRKGNTIGVILDCNTCRDPAKGGDCRSGVQDGYHAGKACGQCLLLSNYGKKLLYPYDLYVTGTIKHADGSPAVNEFVRLYLPNTWTVRTRTTETGMFRLVLGATAAREGEPLDVQLGTLTLADKNKGGEYALFMLPENYAPCSPD